MFIITGSSPKMQLLGDRAGHCRDCAIETRHQLYRNYVVKHLFWIPLFSMYTRYIAVCERCNLNIEVGQPDPTTVVPAPALHRFGFAILLSVFMMPCVVCPIFSGIASLFSARSGDSSAEARPADEGFDQLFHSTVDDAQLEKRLEQSFVGHENMSVRSAAQPNGTLVRVITIQSRALKNVGHSERAVLLESLQNLTDELFPEDDIFIGLKGRLLWGGYTHRGPQGTWEQTVDDSTNSPEREAVKVLLAARDVAKAAPTTPMAVPSQLLLPADAGTKRR